MPTTIQLFNDYQALNRFFDNGTEIPISATYSHGWTFSNADEELIGSSLSVNNRYSFRVTPATPGVVTITLEDVILKQTDIDRLVSFNSRISTSTSTTAVTVISIFDGNTYVSSDPVTTNIQNGIFTSVRSEAIMVTDIPAGEDYNKIKISIEIPVSSVQPILFTAPNLIHDFGFYSNDFVAGSRQFLPDFYWEIDEAAEFPSYPFFRLIDILTSAASDVRRESQRMYGVELDEFLLDDEQIDFTARSSLTSAESLREEYSQWLAQFSGEKLYRNFQDKDNNLYFSNPSLVRDFLEWQIRNSFYGRAAGTRRAIIEAAKQVVIKTKDGTDSTRSVAVTPLYLDEPFTILVQTLTNETIDAGVNESSNLVKQSVDLAKPLGYEIVHKTVNQFLFTLGSPSLGVLDEFTWG